MAEGSIARLHIEGIADERHYHDKLEQKIARLELLVAGMRAEWDEFIEAAMAESSSEGTR